MIERGQQPRILYIQYTNPAAYPPLENSSQLLAEAGWDVLFLGVRVAGADRLTFHPTHDSIHTRNLPRAMEALPGFARYIAYVLWVLGWALHWRPTWMYASDALACPAGLIVSLVPGVKIIYHEHDAPATTGVSMLTRLALLARGVLARRASLRLLPNERRVWHFQRTVTDVSPTLSVWNCPRRGSVGAPRGAAQAGSLTVLYQGSLVPARVPLTVLEALARLPERVRLVVVGYETQGHRGYRVTLGHAAARMGLAERVEFRNEMPHADVIKVGRACDVGLALLPTVSDDLNLRWMTGASNKAFEYLAAGMAVLVPDLPDWRAMFVQPGYGLACRAEDPDSIAGALCWLFEHQTEMRAMGERGRRKVAAEWNYESQFAAVLQRLEAGLA